MTNIIVLGQQPEKKKIEFTHYLTTSGDIKEELNMNASKYKNVELVCKNYSPQIYFDLMFAYDDDRSGGVLYLGKFNDGVV